MIKKGPAEKPDTLGQFEQLVLTAIMTTGKEAYGIPIYDTVTDLADRRINFGSLYVTMDRLEKKKFISSWLSDPAKEPRRKSKRFYRLEPEGLLALKESVAVSKRITKAFDESWKRRRGILRRPK